MVEGGGGVGNPFSTEIVITKRYKADSAMRPVPTALINEKSVKKGYRRPVDPINFAIDKHPSPRYPSCKRRLVIADGLSVRDGTSLFL